jgi:hypothetical protein
MSSLTVPIPPNLNPAYRAGHTDLEQSQSRCCVRDTSLNDHRGAQTVREGTDAIIELATLVPYGVVCVRTCARSP